MIEFSELHNSNMLSEFLGTKRALQWQPNLVKKIRQNCTDFSSVQDITSA